MKLRSWLSSTCSSETSTPIEKDSMINIIPPQQSVLFADSSSFSDIRGNGSSSSSSSSSTSPDSSDSNSSLLSSLSIATHPSIPSLQKLSPESLNLSVKSLSVTSLKTSENAAIVNFLKVHDSLLFAVSGSQVSVFDVNNDLEVIDTFNDVKNKDSSSSASRGSIKSLAFSDGKIFSAHQDCKIRAWELNTKNKAKQQYKLIATLPTVEDFFRNFMLPKNYIKVRRHKKKLWVEHFDAVSSLAVAADNSNLLYSVSWDKYLKIWRGKDFHCLESIKAHDDAINAVVVSYDGLIYTGSADKKIKVWGKPFGEKKNVLVATLEKHKSAVNALALSSDGSVLFSGSNDRSILVWEKEDSANHMVVTGALRGHGKSILCLIYVSDLLFSGSADRTVRIWHRAFDGRYCCLTVLDGHAKPVRSLAAVPEETSEESSGDGEGGMKVFSGSFDGEIKVWKVMVTPELKTSSSNEESEE